MKAYLAFVPWTPSLSESFSSFTKHMPTIIRKYTIYFGCSSTLICNLCNFLSCLHFFFSFQWTFFDTSIFCSRKALKRIFSFMKIDLMRVFHLCPCVLRHSIIIQVSRWCANNEGGTEVLHFTERRQRLKRNKKIQKMINKMQCHLSPFVSYAVFHALTLSFIHLTHFMTFSTIRKQRKCA